MRGLGILPDKRVEKCVEMSTKFNKMCHFWLTSQEKSKGVGVAVGYTKRGEGGD